MPIQVNNKKKHTFRNVHGNYAKQYRFKTWLFNDPDKKDWEAYNDTTKTIRELIRICAKDNVRLRACGSKWSLSEAPFDRDMIVFSRDSKNKQSLKIKEFLRNDDLEQSADKNEMLFAQCGNTIKDLNKFCLKNKRSLATSGASNGQTIAGAMSTGVNGSAFKFGCVQDFVVGLHIVRGEKKGDSIYLEPASKPIANQQFADKINATLVRDDDLFHAALVSMGAFGYIHGVMIQTVPAFKLINTVKKVDISDAYQFCKTLAIQPDSALDLVGVEGLDLYHVKFYINQYDLNNNIRAEIIYKLSPGQKGIFGDLLTYAKDFILFNLARTVSTILPKTIPKLINLRLPKEGSEVGFLGDIFSDSRPQKGQWACAIGVAAADAERVTKIMIDHFKQPGIKNIPAAFSYRYVKKSKALMAYTKFENTCIIGIDGLKNKAIKKYLEEISQVLIDSGIPHTWHWGKRNLMDASFVKMAYGDNLDLFREKRAEFLSPEVARIFSSKYLEKLGLTTIYA